MKNKNNWSGFLPTNTPKPRAKPKQLESELQMRCVKWFRLYYKKIMLFATPNGGLRNKRTAQILKMEGVTAGVADLCLLYPNHGFHALYIEMKYGKNTQSDAQKEFELYCNRHGYKYVVCNTYEGFQDEVRKYLTIIK